MTVVNSQYLNLNPTGASPREISNVVNNIMNGKTNNTGYITLNTSDATQTTIYDERIGYDSAIILLASNAVSANPALPYGGWQDSTTQSVASITTAYPVTFNTTDYTSGISLVSGSQFKVNYSGLYNVQFSLQISNIDNATHDVSVWFRVNGVDIPKSNSDFGLAPRKNATDPYHVIGSLNFFLPLAKNDYVQLMWSTDSTLVTLKASGTKSSPTRPETPSAILTMQYVSSDGYTSNIFTDPYVVSRSKGSAIIQHPENTVADLTYQYVVIG